MDTRESALDLAMEVGAEAAVAAGDEAASAVLDAAGGKADVVLDFVGAAPTISLGAAVDPSGGRLDHRRCRGR